MNIIIPSSVVQEESLYGFQGTTLSCLILLVIQQKKAIYQQVHSTSSQPESIGIYSPNKHLIKCRVWKQLFEIFEWSTGFHTQEDTHKAHSVLWDSHIKCKINGNISPLFKIKRPGLMVVKVALCSSEFLRIQIVSIPLVIKLRAGEFCKLAKAQQTQEL